MNDKLEVQTIDIPEQPRPTSMIEIVQYAIQSNAGVEQLEKMMQLQERYEANEARKAYHAAMAAFKADPPKIIKDAHVNYKSQKTGQVTDYKHATLANVTNAINSSLSKYGLNATWVTEQVEKQIKVTCKITHVLGHCETTSLSAGPDESGGKNQIQAVASTVTYLERYTLLAGTGLATHEQDDDGAGSESVYISENQIEEINLKLVNLNVDLPKFLTFMKVESLNKIRRDDFNKAIAALKAKETK